MPSFLLLLFQEPKDAEEEQRMIKDIAGTVLDVRAYQGRTGEESQGQAEMEVS